MRGRLDRKYCLGLALEDEGFDFSVLSEFRARLVAGSLELKILDLLLDRLRRLGLVAAGARQRTDSTHVLGRIRSLNRLELAGETIRAALEALAVAVPDWLATVIDASWQQVYGQRIDEIRHGRHPDAARTGPGQPGRRAGGDLAGTRSQRRGRTESSPRRDRSAARPHRGTPRPGPGLGAHNEAYAKPRFSQASSQVRGLRIGSFAQRSMPETRRSRRHSRCRSTYEQTG